MSDDSKLTITRRRALGSLLTFGAATAAVGGGTGAYFSDQADSEDNTIKTGNIDLQTNGNNSPTTAINVGPVAPGDSDGSTLRLDNTGSIDGFVTLVFGTPDTRNDLTEVLEVTIKLDGNVVRKGTFDTVFDGEGEYSNADVPLPSGSSRNLEFEYKLPGAAGNDVQSEVVKADISIQLNQQKESFADIVVDKTGNGDVTSIQAGVDGAPPGAVVLVRDGTYNEAVDITKPGQTLASKNGSGVTRIRANAQNDNRAVRIAGVDDVTVDGFDITFDGNQSPNAEKFGLRATAGSDGVTVRNCKIGGYTTAEAGRSSVDAVRSVGVTVTSEQGPTASKNIKRPVVENTEFRAIRCQGSTTQDDTLDSDSRAKGLALNGDVRDAAVVRNEFLGIGGVSTDPAGAQISSTTSTLADVDDSSSNRFTTSNQDNADAEGTDKPRGISLINAGASTGPRRFTILDNTFGGTGSNAIEGVYGQPSIFFGGSGGFGDHEVYDNVFYHPVDNLRGGGGLRLRNNDYRNNGGYPNLVSADSDVDGGELIDRAGGANYDTTFTI